MFLGHGFEGGSVDFLPSQGIAYRWFDAVVITKGQRTRLWIAGLASANAGLFLGGERHGAKLQSTLAQVSKRFLGDGSPDRAGRQVKDAFEFSFTQRFDRREQHGDGLANAGGSGEEQSPAIGQYPVGGDGQIALPRTISREWKGQCAYGLVPFLTPPVTFAEPIQINAGGRGKEVGQFGERGGSAK